MSIREKSHCTFTCAGYKKLEAENKKLKSALEDISIMRSGEGEYTDCNEWEGNSEGDLCPCIECWVCVARYALGKPLEDEE